MYQTISKNTTFEVVEKKSKFIANLIYVENKEEAENIIKTIKKKYYDGKHNCYAYRILEKNGMYEKSSDDGEPSGTAGSPMLNILKKNNLSNVIVIVTRYFGGILLGTGGLVRCYSSAVIGSIEKSVLMTIEDGVEFQIELSYSDFQNIQRYFNQNNIRIIKSEYGEKINCTVEMSNKEKELFLKNIENKELNLKILKQLREKYIKK